MWRSRDQISGLEGEFKRESTTVMLQDLDDAVFEVAEGSQRCAE